MKQIKIECPMCKHKFDTSEIPPELPVKVSFFRTDGTDRAVFDNIIDAKIYADALIELQKKGIIKWEEEK